MNQFKKVIVGYKTQIFIALATLSMLLVPWVAYYYRPYFVYYNGSDEQLYLTYQGGLALLDNRGRWLTSHLVVWAHEFGISGAVLNLLLDILAPLTMLALMAFIIKSLWNFKKSWTASWFIVYGSILFNKSNPIFENAFLDFRYDHTFWVTAYEGFAPYIRSPEPQISLLLALVTWLVFLRTRWKVLLLLPIPFLYENVILPYIYIVFIYFGRSIFKSPLSIKKEVLLNLSAFIFLAISIHIADSIGTFKGLEYLPSHYRHNHLPTISFALILGLLTISYLYYRDIFFRDKWTVYRSSVLTIAFLQFFITNHTIISGVSIFPQGLQNVGGTFGSAFLMLFFIGQIKPKHLFLKAEVIISICILLSINNSQGLQLNNRYRLKIFNDITKEDLQSFRLNPLEYIGGTQEFKGYVALAYPKQLMPLMAHLYDSPWFIKSCEPIAKLHISAISFVEAHMDDPELAANKTTLQNEISAIKDALNNPVPYGNKCPDGIPSKLNFKIYPSKDDSAVYLNFFPPKVKLQGRDF
jgi:hypothetical protein